MCLFWLPFAASKRSSSFLGISRAGCLLNILATNAKFNFSIPFAMSFGFTNSLKWNIEDSGKILRHRILNWLNNFMIGYFYPLHVTYLHPILPACFKVCSARSTGSNFSRPDLSTPEPRGAI